MITEDNVRVGSLISWKCRGEHEDWHEHQNWGFITAKLRDEAYITWCNGTILPHRIYVPSADGNTYVYEIEVF